MELAEFKQKINQQRKMYKGQWYWGTVCGVTYKGYGTWLQRIKYNSIKSQGSIVESGQADISVRQFNELLDYIYMDNADKALEG